MVSRYDKLSPPWSSAQDVEAIVARLGTRYAGLSMPSEPASTSFLSTISGAFTSLSPSRKGKGKVVEGCIDGLEGCGRAGSSWTGAPKSRESRLSRRDEGPGGPQGIVLPMEMVGAGIFDAVYTIPVRVGPNQQNLSIQVDTGSSDLWFASTSCSSSACSQTGGRLYDASSSTPTGQEFDIPYLRGRVSGPIVWDRLEVGGYSVENQALAAADSVVDEPLTSKFVGILGLALPLNSIIASLITPVTNNAPDGQSLTPNLFSITPRHFAPSYRFISLSLSRPGSDYPPSLLSIGRHPTAIRELHKDNDTSKDVDPSKVFYSTVVSERSGILFWKVVVRAITVWVDDQPREVTLGRGLSGSPWPTAVVDSGVPLILTTSTIANGIYGAIGVNPASDGQYYVPCKTPLNLTLTLDDRPPISLHPLDLTGEPPRDNSAQFCIGIIQAADAYFLPSASTSATSNIGDMILGVPFMRNVYSVMSYDPPDVNGTMPNTTTASAAEMAIRPRLGLLPLTDARIAMDEFQRVRVAHQPLSTGSPKGGGGSGTSRAPSSDGGKVSVGIAVLIGLVSFFALCFGLFGLRWFITRRRWRRAGGVNAPPPPSEGGEGMMMKRSEAYQLARSGSMELTAVGLGGGRGAGAGKDEGKEVLSEDELRTLRYSAYMKKERMHSEYTMSSGRTLAAGEGASDAGGADELGVRRGTMKGDERSLSSQGHGGPPSPHRDDHHDDDNATWNPETGLDWGEDDTATYGILVGGGVIQQPRSPTRDRQRKRSSSMVHSRPPSHSRPLPQRNRTTSELYDTPLSPPPPISHHHERGRSVSVPLLQRTDSPNRENFDGMPYVDEFGEMRGVGSVESGGSGGGGAGIMAGVGTAARSSRIETSLPRRSTSSAVTAVDDSPRASPHHHRHSDSSPLPSPSQPSFPRSVSRPSHSPTRPRPRSRIPSSSSRRPSLSHNP